MVQLKNYKKEKLLAIDDYLNIIFKIMQDGLPNDTIYYYLRYLVWAKSKYDVELRLEYRGKQLFKSHTYV